MCLLVLVSLCLDLFVFASNLVASVLNTFPSAASVEDIDGNHVMELSSLILFLIMGVCLC